MSETWITDRFALPVIEARNDAGPKEVSAIPVRAVIAMITRLTRLSPDDSTYLEYLSLTHNNKYSVSTGTHGLPGPNR